MSVRRAFVWMVVATVALAAAVACGQDSDEPTPRAVGGGGPGGGIAGIVTDLDGAPVAGMRVFVISSAAAFPEIAPETNEEGRYQIGGIVPGKFEVGVRDKDGQRIGLESVIVNSGETASRNFSVSVGASCHDSPGHEAPSPQERGTIACCFETRVPVLPARP